METERISDADANENLLSDGSPLSVPSSSINKISLTESFTGPNHAIDYNELRIAQSSDDRLIRYLNKSIPTQLNLVPESFNINGEIVNIIVDLNVYTGLKRIYVPMALVNHVIKCHHDFGHSGVRKTKSCIKTKYVWYQMSKDIVKFVTSCHVCQIIKPGRLPRPDYGRFKVVRQKFEHIHMDICTLPLCRGFKYVLVIVDRFSRFPFAFPMRDMNAQTIIDTFLTHFVSLVGIPKRLTTDRGANFTSYTFQSFVQTMGIQHCLTSAYSPWSDGVAERFVRTFTQTLCAMLQDNLGTPWVDLLPSVMLVLRNTVIDEDTGITPSLLMFGQESTLPGRIFPVEDDPPQPLSRLSYVGKLKQYLKLPLSPKFESKRAKVYVPKSITDCEFVLLRDKQYGRGKLEPTFTGPHRVLRRYKNHFIISRDGKTISANLCNLKPYFCYKE
jgi:transposase InsO family protein